MQLGIFTDVVQRDSPEAVAGAIREYGFDSVQLRLRFPGMDLRPGSLTTASCRRIHAAFAAKGLHIAALAAYTNLIHPDRDRRAANLSGFRQLLSHCRYLGTAAIATEAGTFNADDEWGDHPRNRSKAGFQEMVDVVGQVATWAEQEGVILCLEPYVLTALHSARTCQRLIAAVNSPYVKLVIDPAGLIQAEDVERQDAVLTEAFALCGEHCALAHAEDVYFTNGEPHFVAAGTGSLDYVLYTRQLLSCGFRGTLILEHLGEPDIVKTLAYVQDHLSDAGAA